MTSRETAVLPQALIDFAHSLADAASLVTAKYFRQTIAVDIKPDESPATIADKQAELAIRALIGETYPNHGVIGEEFPSVQPDAEFVWVIDPIDGTMSYITGRPLYGTLIALVRDGKPVLGVIDHAAVRDRWVGALGRPTTLNGEIVQVRKCPDFSRSTLMTNSPMYYRGSAVEALERLQSACDYTMYGTECMAYGLVASGHADIAIDAGMDIFDYLAAVPVVEGAGGIMTDWKGQPLGTNSGDRVVAVGDPNVHEQVLALLAAD